MNNIISSNLRSLKGIIFILAILSIPISCTKSMDGLYGSGGNSGNNGSKGGPGVNEVWIEGMAFSPTAITVTAGTTITWTNKDLVAHTVTSNTGLFDSGSISTNGTYSYLFSKAGTYDYKCTIHSSMTASVIVK